MSKMTISKLLELQKALKERKKDLSSLTAENSKKIRYWGSTEKSEEPLYDAVALDEMVTELNNALYEISAELKQINATTEIEINVDFKHLMRPIPKTSKLDG